MELPALVIRHHARGEVIGRIDWTALLVGQWEFFWAAHLRPRREGLTDDQYFCEPVNDCWRLRPDQDGHLAMDGVWPEPEPAAGNNHRRGEAARSHRSSSTSGQLFLRRLVERGGLFDPRHPVELPAAAVAAVAYVEQSCRWWHDGIAALDEESLAQPLGWKGAQFADDPMAELMRT